MNGEIAQLVALVAHGNAFLADGAGPAPELFPAHTTFRFVADLHFSDIEASTAGWFARLRDRGARRLWLIGPTKIAAEGRREVWVPVWRVKDAHAPDQRVWSVTYRRTWSLRRPAPGTPVVDAARGLERALVAAEDFARTDSYLTMFADSFVEARDSLAAFDPEIPYHPDLVPPSWDVRARQLLAAAARAWVFGGMGSWNDVYFEYDSTGKTYAAVSDELYSALTTAIAAAANADPR